MKTKILHLLLLVVTIVAPIAVSAKDRPSESERRAWMEEMQNYRKEYIIKALQLNDAQKGKFLPLYEAMTREMGAIDSEVRSTERAVKQKGKAATDADYQKAADAMFNLHARMGAVEAKYYKQFKSVLSSRQLYELKQAEDRFAREMMRHHREKKDRKK